MKALIVGNANSKIDKISAAQLDPFFRNRALLRQQLGFTFHHIQAVTIAEIGEACLNYKRPVDAIFIRPDWKENATTVVDTVRAIRSAYPTIQFFFIDPWDQVSSRFFGVLPYVDKLLKYQRLKDVQQYHKTWKGGTVITNYWASQGHDLHDWNVSSPVPQGYEDRIGTGWNVVTLRTFEDLLFKPFVWKVTKGQLNRKPKDIDLFCHMSYGSIHDQENWYTEYRMSAVEAAQRLGSQYRLAVSGEFPEARTVSSKQYLDDIRRSRIVFSPFGWGETTWRDYEAVCYDCLLLKPRMDHIDTAPNIYYPNETYVPLEWDFSDLQEKVDFYLRNPDEAARIITNARRLLEGYFKDGGFVKQIEGLVSDRAIVTPTPALATSQAG